ncbi:MAG: DUF4127 family protein [Candidatus Eremiobacteraeota bacterium]|nr:DUF4127 family protein [Candidatus Eremiobacteraeota bacterium]
MLPAMSRAASVQSARSIAFIPLDDRPVTLQLPIMLGTIAGRHVVTPPRSVLGHYLAPGDADGILKWLRSPDTANVSAIVGSLDMVGYGGLVASRVPGLPDYVAQFRLRQFAEAASLRTGAYVAVFGTVMRLAPTGVPNIPQTAAYWATGDTVDLIATYANLPSPPRTDEQRRYAERLRERIGGQTLNAYLGTRRRNLDVDAFALQMAAEGRFDRVVFGQDDAGPTGLHIADVAALTRAIDHNQLESRVAIEPGADELGMVLVSRAMARDAHWRPTVRVRYSRSRAERVVDPLEYVPIDVTIGKLISAVGASRVNDPADIELFVRVNGDSQSDEEAFLDAVADDVAQGRSVAIADLTFLDQKGPSTEQQALTRALIDRGLAGKIDAFASWNTDANTVGTALATAVAVGVGRHTGNYDRRAHAEFMLDRYADDYAFHQFVRPQLNAALRANDVDTSLLVPPDSIEAEDRNRAALWPLVLDLRERIFPEYPADRLTITLPWQRTFEVMLDIRL